MIRFLIAGHGHLASGMKSTLEIIVGREIAEQVLVINAFVDEESADITGNVKRLIQNISQTDQLIIFTDIMHGSVNQCLMSYVDEERIFLVTGMNFPLLCDVVTQYSFAENPKVEKEDLRLAVQRAREELSFVNDVVFTASLTGNEDDFFES